MGKSNTNAANVPVHKIIMVGSGGVGKSAVTLQYMYGDFVEEYDPTKADSYRKKVSINEQDAFIDILDTAGQEEYAAIRDNYYRSGEGFVLVFSLTETQSFDTISEFRDQICRVLDNDHIPLVLVGNKADLYQSRKVTNEKAQALANEWKCPYFETSAKTKMNVEQVFSTILKLTNDSKSNQVNANDSKSQKKKKKCLIL